MKHDQIFVAVCAIGIVTVIGVSQNAEYKFRVSTAPPIKGSIIKVDPATGVGEFIADEALIRTYATNGSLCKVVGHQWRPYSGFIAVHAVNPPPPTPVLRVCNLCKRTEQEICTWREVTVSQIGEITPK